MVDGILFTDNKEGKAAGGPTKIKHKNGLIQFSISHSKTDTLST